MNNTIETRPETRRKGLLILMGLVTCLSLPGGLFAAGNAHQASRTLQVKTVPLTVSTKAEKASANVLERGYSMKAPKVMQSSARINANGQLSKECSDVMTAEKDLIIKNGRKEVSQ